MSQYVDGENGAFERIPVVIGEQMTLTATFNEALLTNVTWEIGGVRVRNYTQATGAGTVQPLADLTVNPITFHWIEPGNVDVVARGDEGEWRGAYVVLAPTAVTMTTITHTVGVRNILTMLGRRLHLHFGHERYGKAGIRWACQATAPALRGGRIACTQLARLHRVRHLQDGSRSQFTSGDEYVLDEVVHYDVGAEPDVECPDVREEPLNDEDVDDDDGEEEDPVTSVAIDAGQQGALAGEDSPGTLLLTEDATQVRCEIDEAFRTYLCFKSAAAGSIWVTLALLEWDWRGTAERRNTAQVWHLLDRDNSVNPLGQPSRALPTWTANKDALAWAAAPVTANCYAYALRLAVNVTPGKNNENDDHAIDTWSDDEGGVVWDNARMAELLAACTADGMAANAGSWRVAVYVNEYAGHAVDFHFFREEANGTWSHKLGGAAPVVNIADHAVAAAALVGQVFNNEPAIQAVHLCGYLFVPDDFVWQMDEDTSYRPIPP
ncbi:MAG TPA: hypothetical protein VF618_02790 [Thermoanaerobaculia bacterium]